MQRSINEQSINPVKFGLSRLERSGRNQMRENSLSSYGGSRSWIMRVR